MNFKEELEQFKKTGLDLCNIMVANEVKAAATHATEDNYETVCSVVNEYWLTKCDTLTSLENVVQAVDKYLKEGNKIEEITDDDILERLVY